jgi:chromate transporter
MPLTMNAYWIGFKTFFKIGCFTIGGGYAMIPLIEEEVVNRRKWLSKEDFLDLMALSQALPGVFAVNFSIYIGYKLKGLPGSICLALGTILPSFLIILAIALCFRNYSQWPAVEAIFKGIRPAVVALIAQPCFHLARAAHIKLTNVWLPVFAALLIWLGGVSPVYIILAVAIGAFLYGQFVKPGDDDSHGSH